MDIHFKEHSYPTTGCIVLLHTPGKDLSSDEEYYNNLCGNIIKKSLNHNHFSGKKGETLVITPEKTNISHFVLVGTGDLSQQTNQDWVNLGGDTFPCIEKLPAEDIYFFVENSCSSTLCSSYFSEGFLLRSYKFDKHKTEKPQKEKVNQIKNLTFLTSNIDKNKETFSILYNRVGAVNITRDLTSELPNILYPETMANEIKKLETLGLKVNILKEKDLEKLGMNALLAVGRGSAKESHVVTVEWNGGSKNDQPLAFVGKGVTFDTGGISLKPGAGMHEMKMDMGGAAIVIGLLANLAKRKAPVNVVGVVGLVENMPGSDAYRPGDVIKSMSGTTIEILNTDAEGRVVLADALWYAQETFNPKLIIDLATLTSAIIISLGEEIAGVFTNKKEIAKQLEEVSELVDEKVWELPMHKLFDAHIKSDVADIKNVGKPRTAGSISAAKFLERFIKKGTPWAHIDVAGVAWSETSGHMFDKGATGFGVRLLDEFIKKYYEIN